MNLLGAIGMMYGENDVVHKRSGKAELALISRTSLCQHHTKQIAAKLLKVIQTLKPHAKVRETVCSNGSRRNLLGDGSEIRIHWKILKQCLLKSMSYLLPNYYQTTAKLPANVRSYSVAHLSWLYRIMEIYLHPMSECLPIFAAAVHDNYLKSSYLYIQKKEMLENTNSVVFRKFLDALFIIRHINQYWAGLGSDWVIEQISMWSLKYTVVLIWVRDMTEYQRDIWTMSVSHIPQTTTMTCKSFNTLYTTSEQQARLHKTRDLIEQLFFSK